MNPERCVSFRPRLQRFADGELDLQESRELRAHLLDCLECRAIVGEVYSLRKFFAGEKTPPTVPAGFASRVAAKAFAQGPLSREERTILPFAKALAAIAAGAVLLVGGYLLVQSGAGRRASFEAQAASPGKVGAAIEKFREARAKEKRESR